MMRFLPISLLVIWLGTRSANAQGDHSWSSWYDRDNPSDTGDWETLGEQKKLGSVCGGGEPIAAECRVKGSSSVFTRSTGTAPDTLAVHCLPTEGVVCKNVDQTPGASCSDYEIRYQCPSTGRLFPHGAGDISVEKEDDHYSAEIIIPVPFPFFGQNVSSAYVSTNGVISFGEGFTSYTPEYFQQMTSSILAVFWGDSDIREHGSVTYCPYIRTSFNEDVFGRAEAVIRQAFGNQFDFTASWMLIATWNKVPFYGSSDDSITNTYQAVIITNSTLSFAMYNYEHIAWTTGKASSGDPDTGLGGTPAQVGYNAGDGKNYYSVPESMTDAIVNIDNKRSNIGPRGRWLFRIDTKANGPNCPNYDHPDYGTVGTCIETTLCPGMKFISGLCPSHGKNVKCCFTANTDKMCATHKHRTYGQVGHCTHTSLCPDSTSYISGLCPTKCAGIKCCFKKPTSRIADCGENVTSLACEVLGHSRIDLLSNNGILNPKGNFDGADAKSNIRDTCAGKKSLISCYSCAGSAPGGSVCLDPKMLEYILSLANDGHDIQVNAISGACHSSNSRHYQGTAVDLQIVESSNYRAWMDKCRSLGAVKNLGPPTKGHKTHTHCAF